VANFQSEREQLALLENLFREKQFAAGLAQAEAILQQFPSSFHLKFLKIAFLKELGRTDQALHSLLEMYSRFGDNILILKELADLNFQQQRFPESLIYYKKLLFLDSFNLHAQERVRHISDMLEAGVSATLSDTQIETRIDDTQPVVKIMDEPGTPISFSEPVAAPAPVPERGPSPGEAELNFDTESAAELYFKQGLFKESLAIYKKLFDRTGKTDHFLRIKAILLLQGNQRNALLIERLQHFLEMIQKRGRQLV
jgi:tetratricopeptide (TPR) repeat protein